MAPFTSPYPPVPVSEESYATFLLKWESDPYPPDAPAYIDAVTDRIITRKTFREQVMALASGFRNLEPVGLLGLHRGSTALVFSPNSILYPVVILALGVAGVCGAHANAGYMPQELAHAFKVSQATHAIVHPLLLPTTLSALERLGISRQDAQRRVILMGRKGDIPSNVLAEGWKDFDDLIPSGRTPLPERSDGAAAQETAALYFSSGTTGLNKAIMLSHINITSVLASLASSLKHYDHGRDVHIAVVPFYHIYGSNLIALLTFLKGVPCVIIPRFEPELFLSALAKHKVTSAMLVPPLLTFLARHPSVDKYDLSSLNSVGAGAAPVIPAMYDLCIKRFATRGIHVSPGCGYGLTETSGIVSLGDGDLILQNPGTVGTLAPNMEGRLVDDDGRDVPEGEPGELWVRGPNVAKGYFNNPQANADTFTTDGWLKTGDVVVHNAHGVLWIVDRKKELIKYKGFQVAPAELEAILSDHPDVADSGVVGVYSEAEATELPRAYVVPKDPNLLQKDNSLADDIQEWLKGRVAHFKLLRGGVVLTEAIPRSAAGKILRRNMRDQAQAHPMRAKL